MIDLVGSLWNLMTIFFTTEVIYNPLFMALIFFNIIFFTIYFYMALLDPSNWDVRF